MLDQKLWRSAAACRDSDPDVFFPTGSTGDAAAQIQQAKTICAGCPVRQACLQFAFATNQPCGVWGGLDENERRSLRRQWRTTTRT